MRRRLVLGGLFLVALGCAAALLLRREDAPPAAGGACGHPSASAGDVGPDAPARALTDADYAAHLAALRERLPESFTIVLEKPFVVVGDEAPGVVRARSERTVKWAVARLKADYFARDPEEIIEIWLFRDRASYEKHAVELFGRTPTTPYGWYSAEHRALVMNISTGGGTLVHEIVHPFVRANFPECPAWFNEGLASLYEQCGERDGHIVGHTNWRLRGLQHAIRAKRLGSIEALTATSTEEFYGENSGLHYAQARYLCYYLQERGLLVRFYRAFRESREDDPAGYATLQEVLGEEDMAAFGKRWEAFVLGLRFRPAP